MTSCKAADDDLTLNQICASEEDDASNSTDPTYGDPSSSDISTRVNPPESIYASLPTLPPERTSSILGAAGAAAVPGDDPAGAVRPARARPRSHRTGRVR